MSDVIQNLVQPEPQPTPVDTSFKIPKAPFKQGIFDPQIANMAQSMYSGKKLAGNAPSGQSGMSPPSVTPGSTPHGGKPGGTPK
jgi:hypothetical protein